jgi:hypothetical protein
MRTGRRSLLAVALLVPTALFVTGAGATAPRNPRGDTERDVVLARQSLDRAGADAGRLCLEIDLAGRRRLLETGRGRVRSFPLPDRAPVDLELESFRLLAPGARFVVVDADGARDVPPPPVRTFRGRVGDDPDSLVALTFFGDRMAGFVRTWDAEYVVGPEVFDADDSANASVWVKLRQDPPNGERPFTCGDTALDLALQDAADGLQPAAEGDRRLVSSLAYGGPAGSGESTSSIDGSTLLTATLAVDATVEFHDHFGSLTATQNYILNLLAQVSTIYESEVLVRIEVGYLRVFTAEPDPYTDGSTSTSVLLADLRSEWTANQTGVERTVTHLLSVRPSGGAGLSYVDVLCNTYYGYGVSTISANGGSWEKEMVAHELGHNFSSRHTHCYTPEIDQCYNSESGCYDGDEVPTVGTIMSYCSQTDTLFHPRVKDEQIRPAAEAAYPACIGTAGLPGAIGQGDDGSLRLNKPAACPAETLRNDDGGCNSRLGYGGTTRIAWIERFTPSCYPFRLTTAQVLIDHASSVAPGRPIRLLVYTDPAGGGDPAMATLVHSEDVTVQVVSSVTFNDYPLSDPVVIASGDYYIGFYDLEADPADTFIATLDSSRSGDSWFAANSTSPEAFNAYGSGTWMIRGGGGAVEAGSVRLEWDNPCNTEATPNQDYAIYTGALGDYVNPSILTCTTGRSRSHLVSDPAGAFFLVVPTTIAAEGSYGLDGSGAERLPAAVSCKPQEIGSCD